MNARKNLKQKKRHKTVSTSPKLSDSSSAKTGAGGRFFLPLTMFLWPFLYLFRLIVPINGYYTAIGNDFYGVYFRYKIYHLANLANFRFPLWSPAEGAGFPLYTNPIVQAFYPLNLLLIGWYKIANGYSPIDYQFYAILGIAIFALGLIVWLRLINNNLRAVVFSVLIMSVSFKITEILRFPNAVHSAAWYPWILYAMTKIMRCRSLKQAAGFGGLLAIFVICLCTAGYPYYVYYGIFLFLPYMLTFAIKPLRLNFFGDLNINWKRAIGTMSTAGVVAILVCLPYIVGAKRLMAQTANRGGGNLDFATKHVFNFTDTIGSLVYPPAASAEGWYFFSITALLIIIIYLICGRLTKRKINENEKIISKSTTRNELAGKLFFLIWLCVITYITYGRDSHLFVLLWKYMPGFSNLRVWGRLNIILVPILAWLLSLAYTSFESMLSDKETSGTKKYRRLLAPVATVIAAYVVILGIQLYLHLNEIYDIYWIGYFKNVSANNVKFIIYGAAAFVAILAVIIISKWGQQWTKYWPTIAATVLVLIATVETKHVGSNMWTYHGKAPKQRMQLDMAKINKDSFQSPRFIDKKRKYLIAIGPNFSAGVINNWYLERYAKFLEENEDEVQERNFLLGIRDGRKVFFSESIEHTSIKSFLADARRYGRAGQLLSYNGDELQWEIQTPITGYLSFIDNWDSGWKVFVDGEQAELKLLFGTFKTVKLPPGHHKVRFTYQPNLL